MKRVVLALLVAGSSCASVAPHREAIRTADAPAPIGPYSQAIRVGDEIWCAGQGSIDPKSGEVLHGDIALETRRTLDNLRAVLRAADASFADVVSVQVFLTDLADFKSFNEVYATYFDSASPPARATVQVSKLPKDLRVEIALVAVRAR